MSSVSCANGVVDAIGRQIPEIKVVHHTEGCGRGLKDVDIAVRTLTGLGKNPNVAGILIVGLGCEFIKAPNLAEAISSTNKPTVPLMIQEMGGTRKTVAEGIKVAKQMLEQVELLKRERCEWDSLIVGLECGGSDALSGLTANPLVGKAADWLVNRGATVILSEITEMIGTEHILARRASSPGVAEQIVNLVKGQRQQAVDLFGDQAHMVISPGNIEGGLSNVIEKSLGCIVKGGTTPINEVIEYGASPSQKGLVIMDTPGSDIFSLTGMAAGGAQLMIFTTGRGTPVGFPIVPVSKLRPIPKCTKT
jgi:altronate dehydratase large subunit